MSSSERNWALGDSEQHEQLRVWSGKGEGQAGPGLWICMSQRWSFKSLKIPN